MIDHCILTVLDWKANNVRRLIGWGIIVIMPISQGPKHDMLKIKKLFNKISIHQGFLYN